MDIDYKCKNNVELCGDTCCKFCLGATECKYACKADPTLCGMSEQYPKVKSEGGHPTWEPEGQWW